MNLAFIKLQNGYRLNFDHIVMTIDEWKVAPGKNPTLILKVLMWRNVDWITLSPHDSMKLERALQHLEIKLPALTADDTQQLIAPPRKL